MSELLVRFLNGQTWDLKYSKKGDVGLDLPAYISEESIDDIGIELENGESGLSTAVKTNITHRQYIDIPPKSYASIPTGVAVKLPPDAWGMIKPRSSTGWKKKLSVFEGVIDTGYTGQLSCLVYNPGDRIKTVKNGERLAQLILVPSYTDHGIKYVEELPETDRGISGFGSTGL